MDFSRFRYFSFDCYGTLIDWERGLLAALQPYLSAQGHHLPDEVVLGLYARFEPEAEHGPFKPYKEILRQVLQAYARHLGFQVAPGDADLLVRALPEWPPFPDTVAALQSLAQTHRLVIISNIDEDLIRQTAQVLRAPFHAIITAEQVGSYKPSHNNFQQALRSLGASVEEVCHVAQSLYHDIAPANALGFNTVWINRRKGMPGTGATPASQARPDLELGSLAELAAMVQK